METTESAGLLRRLAAIFYDGFLVVAIWMTSTMLVVALVTDGDVVSGWPFQIFLYIELAVFYIYFWRATGQTLGMQVWRINVFTDKGEKLTVTDGIQRFLCATLSIAAAGLGFLWMFFNKDRLAWHDITSNTRVIYLGKINKAAERISEDN